MNNQDRLEKIEYAISNIGFAIGSISELAKCINEEKINKVNTELSIVRMQIDSMKNKGGSDD